MFSIAINNYNYGRFVGRAIDSALNQTRAAEVIVVDDGSTDDSRRIIESYGTRIIPLFKENGGPASACNEGFGLSRGPAILFLDADDVLAPTAVERVVPLFEDPDVVKVHWTMWEIDGEGRRTGGVHPTRALPEGNLRSVVLRDGPCGCASAPTSGIAWSRRFLDRVLPMPTGVWVCVDVYLSTLACALGTVRSIDEPQGSYRVHGQNTWTGKSFDEALTRDLEHDELCRAALGRHGREAGLRVDEDLLQRNSWYRRRYDAVQEIKEMIPPTAGFILVDEDEWGTGGSVAGRRAVPFPEHDGYYGGPPPDDDSAIGELERLRQAGAAFIVFAWPAFWWLEHYKRFRIHLDEKFSCVLKSERVAVFNLANRPGGRCV